ncbi:hypothetical protein ES703_54145 [subsurface metagenome]
MEHYELRVLCDFFSVAGLAVNTWARPTPLAVDGELEQDERGEVVYAEVWSPVTGPGVEEELHRIIPVLDGREVGEYVSLSGIRATVMAPPKDRIWAGRLYSFGTPRSNNPLLNTTLKYRQNLTVAVLAGAAVAITQPYRIRLWGYVYKEAEIPAVFGTMQFPAYLTERSRNRTLTLNKQPIPVTSDSWLTLPGGVDQAIPKVNPFIRFAYNLLATDGQQGDTQMRFQTGNVLSAEENMYWEFDERDALLIEGLGIKADAAADLARTGLRIAGDYHPKGPTTRTSLFPTTLGVNQLNYGHLAPLAPIAWPVYVAIPKLDRPLLVWNEIGMVVIRDDGTAAVVVNGVCVALTGIRIEMRG